MRSGQVSDVVFFGTYDNDVLVAYGFGEVRTIGLGFSAMFFVGGPQFLARSENAVDSSVVTEFVSSVESYAKSCGLAFVLFESLVPFADARLMPFSGQSKYLLEPTTRIVDLSSGMDAVLADMKQKGRYNIKIAEKSGVVARHVPSTSENLDTFYGLLTETTNRDGFSGNSRSYYERLLASRTHPAEGLYFAYWQDRVIAAAILTIEGSTAVYYYGASSSDPDARKTMAPYLIQWKMMQSGHAAGCTDYDFLGIAPEGAAHHHLQGVTDFKSKFGGSVVTWPDKQLLVIHSWKLATYRIVRTLRSLVRK